MEWLEKHNNASKKGRLNMGPVQYEVRLVKPGEGVVKVVITVPAGASAIQAAKAQYPGWQVTMVRRLD